MQKKEEQTKADAKGSMDMEEVLKNELTGGEAEPEKDTEHGK